MQTEPVHRRKPTYHPLPIRTVAVIRTKLIGPTVASSEDGQGSSYLSETTPIYRIFSLKIVWNDPDVHFTRPTRRVVLKLQKCVMVFHIPYIVRSTAGIYIY